MAAAFRAIGVDAAPAPDSNGETLELGGLHSAGEECLPHKITLGDFLRICRQPSFDPILLILRCVSKSCPSLLNKNMVKAL